jgi:cyclopropane fatty-acyl-phospholipid synthase-like methyltransferase
MSRMPVCLMLTAVFLMPGLSSAQDKKKNPQEVWNELFAKREGKDHQFNKFLAETVKGRPPGKALDIGMGQGRNSMFLAALGWEVTGFDISEVGVKQAQAEAARRGLKIDANVGDVDKFDYGKERYDLIVGMYMHEYLTRNAAKVMAALKPGGLLVVEGIHRDINKDSLRGEKYGYRNNELPKVFDRLRTRYYEDTLDKADWDRSGGKPVPVVRLIAVKDQGKTAKPGPR